MTRKDIALASFITLTTILLVFIMSIAIGRAAEPATVGCLTVQITEKDMTHEHVGAVLIDNPDHLDYVTVAYYLWLRHAWNTGDSTTNIVSIDMSPYEVGDTVTACTDYIATGVIPQGEGSAALVTATDPDSGVTYHIPHSSLAPHPDIVDAWVTDNGLIAI